MDAVTFKHLTFLRMDSSITKDKGLAQCVNFDQKREILIKIRLCPVRHILVFVWILQRSASRVLLCRFTLQGGLHRGLREAFT